MSYTNKASNRRATNCSRRGRSTSHLNLTSSSRQRLRFRLLENLHPRPSSSSSRSSRRKRKNAARTRRQRKHSFETLEQRQLLTVTPSLVGGAATFQGDTADDGLILRVNVSNQLEFSTDSGSNFTIDLDANAGGDQSLTIASGSSIAIDLGEGINQLQLDDTLTDALASNGVTLTFDGSLGTDALTGANVASIWSITGKDSGSYAVGAPSSVVATFNSVESLTGGTGDDIFQLIDTGVIGDGGRISRNLDGGGGTDTLDFSSFDHEVSVSLIENTASNVETIANLESFVGGNSGYFTPGLTSTATAPVQTNQRVQVGTRIYQYIAEETLPSQSLEPLKTANPTGINYLDPAAWRLVTNNELIGPESVSAWEITGANSGTVNTTTAFSGFQDITGSRYADTFVVASGGSISGTLDGGGSDYFDFTQQSEPEEVLVGERVVVVAAGGQTIYERVNAPLAAAAGTTLDLTAEDFNGTNWNAVANVPDHVDLSAVAGGTTFDLANTRITSGGSDVVASFRQLAQFTANSAAGDQVFGPASHSTWEITAANTVSVGGMQFIDVETVVGSAVANDQFVFNGPSSLISTLVDGGAGGRDSLAFRSGSSLQVVQIDGGTPDQSGSAPHLINSGNTINFANIDPIALTLDAIEGTSGDDHITLQVSSGNLNVTYADANGGTVSFVPLTGGTYGSAISNLAIPLTSAGAVQIDLLGGNDTLTIDANLVIPGKNLEIVAENINVVSDRTIDTRSASSAAGSIVFSGDTITLNENVRLLAQGTGGNAAGDILLEAEESDLAAIQNLAPFALNSKEVKIDVKSGVELRGDDIVFYAAARDKSLKSLASSLFQGEEIESDSLVNDFSIPGLPGVGKLAGIPVKVLLRKSDAQIDIGEGVTIAGAGHVDIRTRATSDSSGEVNSKFFSVGYVQAEAVSKITFADNAANPTNISSGLSTVIRTDGKVKAKLKTKTSRDLGDAGATKLALSAAVSRTDLVSQIEVPASVTIVSQKTANIKSFGETETVADATAGLHSNGVAGLAFGIDISNADIKTEVDGSVTANQGSGSVVKLEFDPTRTGVIDNNRINLAVAMNNTDAQNDTTTVPHDLPTGSPVEYTNRRGTSIGGLSEQFVSPDGQLLAGLVDGETYYVVRDPNNVDMIYLSESAGKARTAAAKLAAGESLSFLPFLGDVVALPSSDDVALNSKTFDLDQVNAETDEITLPNPGFQGEFGTGSFSLFGSTFELGQAVIYNVPTGGTPIGGLTDGAIYYVNVPVTEAGINGDDRFVDKQVIKLSETENKALAGVTLDLDLTGATGSGHTLSATHVLDSGLATGLGVLAELDATSDVDAEAGLDSSKFDANPKQKGLKAKATKLKNKFAFADKVYDFLTRNISQDSKYQTVQNQLGSRPSFSLAGAFSFSITDHKALALVGDLGTASFDTAFDTIEDATTTSNAKLKSREDLEVIANITQSYQQTAASNNEPVNTKDIKNTTYTVDGQQKTTAGSAALTIGLHNNQAKSIVQGGAELDGYRATRVITDVRYPYRTRPDEFIPGSYGELIDKLKSDGNPIDTFKDYIDGSALVDVMNTYSRAFAKADKGSNALAGAVNFVKLNDTAKSIVKSGAMINQDVGFRGPDSNETFSVQSFNYKQQVHVTGVFDLPKVTKLLTGKASVFGSKEQSGGFGGVVFVNLINDTTHSIVETGTQIYTGVLGGIDVVAEEAIMNFSLSQSGSEAQGFGLSGTGAVVIQDSDTRAEVQGGVTIVGADNPTLDTDIAGSPLTIFANSLETNINWAGALAKTNSKSFGITVAINDIERDTNAILGATDVANSLPSTDTNINTSGAITVKANNDGALWAFSAAAAIAGGSKSAATNGNESPVGSQSGKKGKFGIGVSANVSWNTVDDTVNAYINDAGNIIASVIDVLAENSTELFSLAFAASITLPSTSATMQGKTSGTIAGSLSRNTLDGKTRAYVKGRSGLSRLKLLSSGPVNVNAERTGRIRSLSAGLGVEVSRNDPQELALAVAGSASVNEIDNTTEAFVSGIQDDTDTPSVPGTYGLVINSTDNATIFALAGGLSLALGGQNASAGLSLAWNQIDAQNLARLDDSKLSRVETLDVLANGKADIDAIAVAGSLAGGQGINVSLAGTLSINEINVQTEALLSGTDTTVAANGNVRVLSTEVSTIDADSGGFSIAASLGGKGASTAISVGAAVAINDIGQTRELRFDATNSSVVSVSGNSLTIPNHSLVTGQKVTYKSGEEDDNKAVIGGLAENKNYYVIVDTIDRIRLASSESNALAGNAIDLTSLGGGKQHWLDQSLGSLQTFLLNSSDPSRVDAATDTITLPNHDMKTGQRIRYTADSTSFDPSAVNSTTINVNTDTLTINSHGYANGDQVTYTTTGTPIGGLTSDNSYFVGNVSGDTFGLYLDVALTQLVNLTDAGTGDHQLQRGAETPHSFTSGDASTTVSLADESIRITNHGWQNGQILTYSTNNTGIAIGGLVSGNNYYVAERTANTFKLATDAAGTNVVDLIAAGAGTHLFKAPIAVAPADSILLENTDYYVIRQSHDTFKLAVSEEDAKAGTAIDITAAGGLSQDVITSFPDQHRTSAIIDDAQIASATGTITVRANTFGSKSLRFDPNQDVLERINFNPAATVSTSSGDKSVVEIATNQITLLNHGLQTGDAIVYSLGYGDAIGGLVDGTTYFAEVIDVDTIRLRATMAGPGIVDLTAVPSTPTPHAFAHQTVTVNTTTNSVFLKNHGLSTGDAVTYNNGTPTDQNGNIGGLTSNVEYYAIVVNANRIKFALTPADATSNNAISLTSSGAKGRLHSVSQAAVASGIRSLTMGGSLAAGLGGNGNLALSAAGAFSFNKIHRSVESLVRNTADVTAAGSITVDAEDRSKIEADAGGISLGIAGGQSFGAGLSVGAANSDNTIGNRVQAQIDNSVANSTGGNVSVTANSVADIDALTIAGSIAVGASKFGLSLSGAGTGSYNTIANVVDASISGGADVDAQTVSVQATDRSDVDADAGAVALALALGKGAASLSVGLSISEADIDNDVRAAIVGASTNVAASTGAAVVSSLSDATIDTVTLGGALAISGGGLALSAALSGAFSTNDINTDANATIGAGATVAAINVGATSGVQVVSSDDSNITSLTLGASLAGSVGSGFAGSLSIAASASHNTIDNDTLAHISGATIISSANNADVDVIVDSKSNPQIKATSVAASLALGAGMAAGVGISGAGADSRNVVLGSTQAYIDGGSTLGSTIDDVTITAMVPNTSNIDAKVVSVAAGVGAGKGGGGAVTIGVSLADNFVGWKDISTKDPTLVHSYVSGANLSIDGNLVIDAQSNSLIDADVTTVSAALAGALGFSASGAGAGSRVRNFVSTSVQSYINGGTVTARGADAQPISITSSDSSSIDATVNTISVAANLSIAGGSLAIAATESFNRVENTVGAYSQNATVNAPNGAIKMDATEVASITSNAFTAAIGVAVSIGGAGAGSGTNSVNNVNNTTQAYVQGGSVTARDNVELTATDTSTVDADLPNFALSGGLVALAGAVSITENNVNPNVRAYLNGGVTSTAGDVKATATSNATATAETLTVAVAAGLGVGVAVVDAGTTIGGTTEAYIGSAGNVNASNPTNGNVVLVANSRVSSNAKVRAGAGSLLGSAVLSNARSVTQNTTQTHVSGNVTTRNLTATAEVLSNTATVDTTGGAGGFVAVTAPNSTAEAKPTINAYVGSGGNVNVVGDVTLQAKGRAEADSSAAATTIGGVAVNTSQGNATLQPTVDASVRSGATVKANNVNVLADLVSDGGQSAPSDLITAIDTAADTVDISFPLNSGDIVEYSATGGSPIGGLVPRPETGAAHQYNILDVANGKVRFGNGLNASTDVDGVFDIITFDDPHNFVSGDQVIYDAAGGTSILGTTPASLFVRVVDGYRIRLTDSLSAATAPDSSLLASLTSVNSSMDRVFVPSNGFANGQAVTYRSQNAEFANEAVDVNVLSDMGNFSIERDEDGNGLHSDNDNLFLADHGFATGDRVRYRGSGIGLVDDTNYFVIVINSSEIQLASTRALAIALDPTALELITPSNQGDRHSLARDMTGLRDGTTYYVVDHLPDSFRLALTPGGTATAIDYIADQNGPINTHRFGTLGLDLHPGTGTQTLRIDLTSAPVGTTHRLVGEGGISLASTIVTSGDGISSVTGKGGTGGLIASGSPAASLTLKPTVQAHIDGTVTTVRDVSLLANAATQTSAYADATSGGLVDNGNATATIGPNDNRDAFVTAASVGATGMVEAGNNFTAMAQSQYDATATAKATGGGAFVTKRATAKTDLIDRSTVEIKDGGMVTAGNLATLVSGDATSTKTITSNADSNARNGGFSFTTFARANSDTNVDSESKVRVGKAASLMAQHVDIHAFGHDAVPVSTARARANGLLAVPNPTANRNLNLRTNVEIDGNATAMKDFEKTWVRGDQGVDIQTSEATVGGSRNAIKENSLLGVAQGSDTIARTQNVNAKQGAVVAAGPRSFDGAPTPLFSGAGMSHLGLYVNNTGTTTWDADVMNLLARPTAELIVSADGTTTGLLGEYFSDTGLNNRVGTRLDSNIDFNWGAGTPGLSGVPADNFSVRWTGTITPTDAGSYTFRTASDDGVRLWVNDQLLIDKFVGNIATLTSSIPIALNANQAYDIRLEYLELGGAARVNLQWSRDAGPFEVVPTAHLAAPAANDAQSIEYNYDGGTDTYTINRVARPGADVAQVLFAGAGTLTKSAGVTPNFRYQQAYEQVRIDIQDDANVVLNNLSASNSGLFNDGSIAKRPGDDVRVNGPILSGFEFDLVPEFQPSKTDKTATFKTTNFDLKAKGPITINGDIDNPLGTTSIVTTTGGIISTGTIRTNELTITTPDGNIGSAANRLNVELVVSQDDCETDGLAKTKMTANAGQNIYTDVRGLLRATGNTPPVTKLDINIDRLDAGGFVDLQLLEGWVQTTPPTVAPEFNFTVTTNGTTTSNIKNHYTPDNTTAINYPLGIFGTGTTPIETTYTFGLIEAGGGTANPVHGNIDVVGVYNATPINITGNTNTVPTAGQPEGNLDFSTNGNINLTETAGNMRVGLIQTVGANGGNADVSLIGDAGSIVDATDAGDTAVGDVEADVVGANINLIASLSTLGTMIGTAANPLDIDSSNPVQGSVLAFASTHIHLIETSGDLRINTVATASGNAGLTSTSGSLVDADGGTDTNVLATQITLTASSPGQTIGTISDPFEISDRPGGWLLANADSDIVVTDKAGDLGINQVQSATGAVVLVAEGGGMIDHANDSVADITTSLGSVSLTASGFIGTATNPLEIETPAGPTHTLAAMAGGGIYLTELSDDLHLNQVNSTAGDVALVSPGAILDPSADAAADVLGNSISLVAGPTHTIGTGTANPLEIDVRSGALTATAGADIFVTDTIGTFNIDLVASQTGNATLVALGGDMLEGGADAAADITANLITLTSNTGGIGSQANAIEINTPFTSTGAVTANAQGDINLAETIGDFLPLTINSQAGNATISSLTGWIVDTGTNHRISGESVTLNAPTGGIGVSNNPINVDTRSGGVSGTAEDDIFVDEVSFDLGVGQVTSTSGDVTLTAPGRILEAGNDAAADVSGNNITLNAATQSDPGPSVLTSVEVLNAGQSIQSPNGQFTLVMQGDGNLVVYGPFAGGTNVYWASGTNGTAANRTVVGSDGNLRILDASDNAIYETASGAVTTVNAQLHLDDNGQVVVYRHDGQRVWQSVLGNGSGAGTVLAPTANEDGFIGLASNALEINTQGGMIDASAGTSVSTATGQSIYLTETTGNLRINDVIAHSNQVVLTANNGSIVDGSTGDYADVQASTVSLNAPQGSIGVTAGTFIIRMAIDADVLNASARDGVFLEETQGDLRVGLVESSNGNVDLVNHYGGILEEGDDAAADIVGTQITLDVQEVGALGSLLNPIEIDSRDSGSITAIARQGVFLTDTSGNLRVDNVTSLTGDVMLRATGGTLEDATNNSNAKVTGNSITLEAGNGRIGGSANALEINSSNSVDHTVTATATGDIFLTETSGDLDLNLVHTTGGNVTLIVSDPQGGIYDANPGVVVDTPFQTPNVVGNSVELNAGTRIGLISEPLDIDASNTGQLIAISTSGIFLTDTAGDVYVANVTSTTGNVRIVANGGDILEFGDDAAADITAHSIDLVTRTVNASTIGAPGNPLEINSSNAGRLFADASQAIHLTETQGTLNVLLAGVTVVETASIFDGASAVNADTDEITIPSHRFGDTGGRVLYSTSGTAISPLVSSNEYFLIIIDTNTVKLATTLANALAGNAIDLAGGATGSHRLDFLPGSGSVELAVLDGPNTINNFNLLESGQDLSPLRNRFSGAIHNPQGSILLTVPDNINAPEGTRISGLGDLTNPAIVVNLDDFTRSSAFFFGELLPYGPSGSTQFLVLGGSESDTVAIAPGSSIWLGLGDVFVDLGGGTNDVLGIDPDREVLANPGLQPAGAGVFEFVNTSNISYQGVETPYLRDNAGAANNPPVHVLPNRVTTPVNQSVNLGVSLIELDSPTLTTTITLTGTVHGSLTATQLSGTTVTQNGPAQIVIDGVADFFGGGVQEVVRLHAGFIPEAGFRGIQTLRIETSDNIAAPHTGGDTDFITIVVGDEQMPTANLSNPTNNGTISASALNTLDYVEITFADDIGVDHTTINGDELRLSGPGVDTARLVGSGQQQGATSTYRFPFTGDFAAGQVNIDFIAGTFLDLAGKANLAETEIFTVVVGANAPSIDSTPPTTTNAAEHYQYPVTTTDADTGEALIYSLDVAPAGMSIHPESGMLQWVSKDSQIGDHTVTVRVTDVAGLSDTQTFTLAVGDRNQPPTLTVDRFQTATAGQPFTYTPMSADVDGDTRSFSLIDAPAGMTINAGTGQIQWTPTSGQIGTEQAVTVKASTPFGEFASDRIHFTVNAANSDFDTDGDVDGADFLAWQRGLGTIYSSVDLTNWQSDYGQSGVSSLLSTAVSSHGTAPIADAIELEVRDIGLQPAVIEVSHTTSTTRQFHPANRAALIDAALTLAQVEDRNPETRETDWDIAITDSFEFKPTSPLAQSVEHEPHGTDDSPAEWPNTVEENEVEQPWLTSELLEAIFE